MWSHLLGWRNNIPPPTSEFLATGLRWAGWPRHLPLARPPVPSLFGLDQSVLSFVVRLKAWAVASAGSKPQGKTKDPDSSAQAVAEGPHEAQREQPRADSGTRAIRNEESFRSSGPKETRLGVAVRVRDTEGPEKRMARHLELSGQVGCHHASSFLVSHCPISPMPTFPC